MAHLVESMAYTGDVPWHGLGVSRPEGWTDPNDMLKDAGLDWTVERRAAFINWKNEKVRTGQIALVRSSDGRILTHVSDNWHDVQNHQAANFFHEFVCQDKSMIMHTAGSLDNGRKVWFLAKLAKSFKVHGKDLIDSYLLFTLPHEYGKCLDIRFTPIRVVCNNTLTLALKKKGDMVVRLNHTRKFNPEFVKQTLGIADLKMDQYSEMAEFLAKRKATKEKTLEFFKNVFPLATGAKALEKDPDAISRPAKQALEIIHTQPGAEYAEGTWWQVFNTITYMSDHVLGHSPDTRLQSAWYGNNRERKLKALQTAVEFAEAA